MDFDPNVSSALEGATIPETPAPATPSSIPAAQPATPAAFDAPAPATPGPHGAPQGYVPSYRLREYSERVRALEAQVADTNRRAALADQYEKQVRALTGLQAPPDPHAAAIQEQFYGLFPQAKNIFDKADQIEKLFDKMQDLERLQDHYYNQYSRSGLDRLYEAAAPAYGGTLPEETKYLLYSAFSGYVQSNPEAGRRFESDPNFAKEFWNSFQRNVLDPVRRAQTVTTASRVPTGGIPQDRATGVPTPAAAPKPANLDDRIDQAWNMFEQTRRDAKGRFVG